MATWKPNHKEIDRVLHGRTGPVYRTVSKFAISVAGLAKPPVDTGRLRDSIKVTGPRRTRTGLVAVVGTYGSSITYAKAVHQGRDAIRPVNKPHLKFFWKAKGRFHTTDYVRPRAGRPYLFISVREANALQPPGEKFKFKISPGQSPRVRSNDAS